MLYAYIDESGQEADEWVFIAGYLGNEDQWRQVATKWAAALASQQRTTLHMKRLRWGRDSTRRLLAKLGPIPTECGLTRIIMGVRVQDYSDLVAGTTMEKRSAGYLQLITPLMMFIAQSLPGDERAEVVFEAQDRYSALTNEHLTVQMQAITGPGSQSLRTSDGKPRIAKWSFLPKGSSSLLETADYLAYAVLQTYRDRTSKKTEWCKSIISDADGGSLHIGHICTRDEIRSILMGAEQWSVERGQPLRKSGEEPPHVTVPRKLRLSQDRIPKLRCPECNADIDISREKILEPISICHGWAVVNPPLGEAVCTVGFYKEKPNISFEAPLTASTLEWSGRSNNAMTKDPVILQGKDESGPTVIVPEYVRSEEYIKAYVNSVQIVASQWEFRLLMGEWRRDSAKPIIDQSAEIIMSPPQAKVLSAMLANQIQEYEQRVGVINIGGTNLSTTPAAEKP